MHIAPTGSKISKMRVVAIITLVFVLALSALNLAVFADEEDTEVYIEKLYLRLGEPDSNGKYHYVGEDSDSKYKTLSIDETGETLQLDGFYQINGSSKMYQTAGNGPLGTVLLDWKTSDNSVASVSPNGLVTPKKDGDVTITATVKEESKYKGSAPSKSVKINVTGQTGKYVKMVRIIDENGKSLSSKDDEVTVIDGAYKFFNFYVQVTWYDPSTKEETIEDTSRGNSISSTVTWSIGGSAVAGTINEHTGRYKSGEDSVNCYVQCVVTGGKGGASVKDTASVKVDTGTYTYNPASSLKIKVVYQKYPDNVVQESTYSLSQLSNRLKTYTNSYTIVGGSKYGTIRAKGYLFKDIVGLEHISIDDVYQFRFNTADGYDNPVTSKLLYGSGNRYYFPNWDISSKSGAKVVPPILATESNMIWGSSEVDPNTSLDSGTRFRLVFGTLWDGSANSSYQIYYIRGITIVLKGAPPASKGHDSSKGTGGSGSGAGGDGGGVGGGYGDGEGKGNGSGSGGTAGNDGVNSNGGGGGAGKAGSIDGANNNKAGGNWTVYEMISNSKSNVEPLDMDIPYLPAAIPVAIGGLAAGSISYFISFRRRML